jgi:hypothetical protein
MDRGNRGMGEEGTHIRIGEEEAQRNWSKREPAAFHKDLPQ